MLICQFCYVLLDKPSFALLAFQTHRPELRQVSSSPRGTQKGKYKCQKRNNPAKRNIPIPVPCNLLRSKPFWHGGYIPILFLIIPLCFGFLLAFQKPSLT